MAIYDPSQVIVSLGTSDVTGFADGTFITISPNSEQFTRVVGADGEVAFAKSNDFTYNITLTVLQTSSANAALTAFAEFDRLSNSGAFPIGIADLSGSAKFFAAEARIQQSADVEYSKEISERAWTIITSQAVNIVGSII